MEDIPFLGQVTVTLVLARAHVKAAINCLVILIVYTNFFSKCLIKSPARIDYTLYEDVNGSFRHL